MTEGDKVDVKLALDRDAATMLLELAGSQRKQGEYVSQLIRAAHAGRPVRLQVLDRLAELEQEIQQLRASISGQS